MDDEKILKDLDNHLTLSFYIDMTQDRLDKLIDYCIYNNNITYPLTIISV